MRSGRRYINPNFVSSAAEACVNARTEVKVISTDRVRGSNKGGLQSSTRVFSGRTTLVSAQAGKMVSCSHLLVVLTVVVSVSVAVLAEGEAQVHIVHVEKGDTPLDEVESKHIEVLSSVCGGSHEKAKELLVYHYKHGMRGFSAKLTPEQVEELSKKPGVIAVNKQGVAHLHGGAATTGAATTGAKGV